MANVWKIEMRRDRLKLCLAEANSECAVGALPRERIQFLARQLRDRLNGVIAELDHYSQTPEPSEETCKEVFELQLEVEELLSNLEFSLEDTPSSLQCKQTSMDRTSTRLPKLELPHFAGDQLRFSEFWDRFSANVHQRSTISNADKFSYLLSCLEGSALLAVCGLTTSDANYTIAVDILQRRFGAKNVLIDAHYTELNRLPAASEDSQSCRETLDAVEKNIRVLEDLGEAPDGNHLRSVILSKFPAAVVHELHLLMEEDNSVPTVRKILQRIVTAKEKSSVFMRRQSEILTPIPATTATTEVLHFQTEDFKPKERSKLKRKKETSRTSTGPSPAKKSRYPCMFCGLNNHISSACKKFKSQNERIVQAAGRCFKCLSRNHKTEDCKRKIACFRCQGPHRQILCPKEGEDYKIVQNMDTSGTICVMAGQTFLQMAVVTIRNPRSNKQKKARVILDTGSQRSYVTESLAQSLKLLRERNDKLLIYIFGASTPQETSSPSTEVVVETKRGVVKKMVVNIVPHIANQVSVPSLNVQDIDMLADDKSTGEGVDMLIGNDYYCSFMREDRKEIDTGLYVIDTDFGWVLSGNLAQANENVLTVTTYCQCHVPSCPYFTEPDLPLRNIDVKFLWSLENIGITDSPKATRQEEAIQHFNDTVQFEGGRYVVKWPWVDYPPELPSNFGLAFGRLKSLLKRIDSESLEEYQEILKEQLELGIIEVIDPMEQNQDGHPVHYLPHHIVKQKGKRGRLVYDASAKTTGQKSLNECLYSGPSLLEDLTALLLRFRVKKIGLTADVEKAFLQLEIQTDDRDVTRFLWLKDVGKGPSEENLLYLRFCRVPFGVISSPFLLNATLRHHIAHANENLVKTIAERCYVDNLVTGADSVSEAREIYENSRAIFNQISMNIRDWVSNDAEFMQDIPEAHKAKKEEVVKVLGLLWNLQEDELKLSVTKEHFRSENSLDTKRQVLRALARIYDPCGFVCPLILPIKIMFQNICEMKVKWDTKLPEDVVVSLEKTMQDLEIVQDVKLPRYVGAGSPEQETVYELHCFTDASKNAYAAVVYLKARGQENTEVSFIIAKSHISRPEDKDDVRIPRLELLGFLIGSRLLKYVKNSLDLKIEKEFLWTDSLVVLGWMRSNKLLPPFVANRVKEIKRNHQLGQMCYIHTKGNPADIATRPELYKEKKELWYEGPEFLKHDEKFWPSNRYYESHMTLFSVQEDLNNEQGYSGDSLTQEPAVAQVRETPQDHLVDSTERREPEKESQVVEDIRDTRNNSRGVKTYEIKRIQQEFFPEEMTGKKTQLMNNLDLFLDVEGVLRCRGRMANTTWSYDMKYPVLLPRECDLTNRIIKEYHEDNYHVGAAHTLSLIRERYWIPQGRVQVQKVIKKCPQCVKYGGGPFKLPPTPALPPERVNYYEPFTFTGVDYLGPLFVSTAREKEKRWIALFTCLTVRAVHLEVVKDLTAEETLLALRRFAATRGVPKRMYSDNATCFKLTAEVMQKPYCADKGIKWNFIPQLAPWHGGYYERLVALVKHSLKRTLEKHLLNDSKLNTVIKEIEGVVNSRPLTHVGTEISHVLKPADFLSLKKCLVLNPSTDTPCIGTTTKNDLIESWKKGIKILEEFKGMFIGQYLASLRERYHNSPKQPRIRSDRAPQVGDVVQIKADTKNRLNWKVGEIVELLKGRDGLCRVARVNVEGTQFTRSIGHLYPLEMDPNEPQPQPEVVREEETDQTRPRIEDNDLNPNSAVETTGPRVPEPEESPHKVIPEEPIEDHDMESHRDGELEPSASIEIESCEQPPDIELDTPSEIPVLDAEEPQQEVVETRNRRDAAVRAREKILEWTRQLLVLLN